MSNIVIRNNVIDLTEPNDGPAYRQYTESQALRWAKRFLGQACEAMAWSKDRSTRVACVLYDQSSWSPISIGYNGFPRGCNDNKPERHERPLKYKWTEHSERNAIYNCARLGNKTEGAAMVLPWYPCVDCARAIIQSGISVLFCFRPDFNDARWGEDFRVTSEMFEEVGLTVIYMPAEWKPMTQRAENVAHLHQLAEHAYHVLDNIDCSSTIQLGRDLHDVAMRIQ